MPGTSFGTSFAGDQQHVREGNTRQITSAIQTGTKSGMIEMDTAIRALYDAGLVSARAAYDKAINKELFEDLLGA